MGPVMQAKGSSDFYLTVMRTIGKRDSSRTWSCVRGLREVIFEKVVVKITEEDEAALAEDEAYAELVQCLDYNKFEFVIGKEQGCSGQIRGAKL